MLQINTCYQYLVRASLTLGSAPLPCLDKLPVYMGPFKLAYSPNAVFYYHELGEAKPEWVNNKTPDSAFPISLFYIEYHTLISKKETPTKRADEDLELLESLILLFQSGEVSVRRHKVWEIKGDKRQEFIFSLGSRDLYEFKPLKPPPEGLHQRPPYQLNDDILDNLIEFVDACWLALDKIDKKLRIALARFNFSYEKRDLADRLIDLIIALEALFGDEEFGNIAYKVAIRCASWLHKLGKARHRTFCDVKERYSSRNKIVHGKNFDLTEQQLTELEHIVRESLRKFLQYQSKQGKIPDGNKLDKLMTTGAL